LSIGCLVKKIINNNKNKNNYVFYLFGFLFYELKSVLNFNQLSQAIQVLLLLIGAAD